MIGRHFGRLLVLFEVEARNGHRHFLCRCSCGEQKEVSQCNLATGRSQSCGCLMRELNRKRSTTHGHCTRTGRTAEYNTWSSMIQRCENPNNGWYASYGGRGITVSQRWHSFAAFLDDMGPRPRGRTLDRKNNDGNYEPGNCRWATASQQRANCRAHNASGVRGVYKDGKKWRACLGDRYLGMFSDLGSAAEARRVAEESL